MSQDDVTGWLVAWGKGDPAAKSRLMEAVYIDLRRVARRRLGAERGDHSLTPTALVVMRSFGGLTIEETAEAVQSSPATVKRDWIRARAWLFRELSHQVAARSDRVSDRQPRASRSPDARRVRSPSARLFGSHRE